MATDLGDYDAEAVSGNPFGSTIGEPSDYHVEPVDYNPFTPAYHGTTAPFEEFAAEPSESYMPDRMLGHHFAKDPAVSNAFIMNRYNEAEHDPKPGGRIIPVNLPAESHFLPVEQPQYDWAREQGLPVTNRNIASDQTEIAKMIANEAFPQNPGYLARSLQDNLAMPEDHAWETAHGLIKGGTVRDGGRDYTLREYINNRLGAFPFDAAMKRDMTRIARENWQKQGYKGLRYTNTSPMETMPEAGVKDPTSYVLFDPKDAVSRWAPQEPSPRPMFGPQAVTRPPTGLVGMEEGLARVREGLEPPSEWRGGRVGLGDLGHLA